MWSAVPWKAMTGTGREARARVRIAQARHRGDRGDDVGGVAGELAGHPAAAGDAGRVDPAQVDAVPAREVADQAGQERDVTRRAGRRVLPVDHGLAGDVPVVAVPVRDQRLRVGDDEVVRVGSRVHPAELLFRAGCALAAVQVENQRELALAGVAGRDVDDDRALVAAHREGVLQRPAGLVMPAARRSRRGCQSARVDCRRSLWLPQPAITAARSSAAAVVAMTRPRALANTQPGCISATVRLSDHGRKPLSLRRHAGARAPELDPPDGG